MGKPTFDNTYLKDVSGTRWLFFIEDVFEIRIIIVRYLAPEYIRG
jgi:hypothetical protein